MPTNEIVSEPKSSAPEPEALPPEPEALLPEPEALPPEPQALSPEPKDPTGRPFIVPGQFSVNSPGNGFQWQLVRTLQFAGVDGRVYACTKEGSTSATTLTVEERTADTEGKRIATIKAHYNVLYQGLTGGGFTELKGTRPSLESPIPNRVSLSFSCRKPDGSPAFVYGLTVFGKNVYSLQVMAGTMEQTNEFIDIAKSFRELPH